ncbi:MAG: zf-HC2 domain-containing protein [Candidatus Aminicenantales bacterium]
MNCRRAKQIIPLYAGGELADKKARRLEQHLNECVDCREMAEEFRAALARIRTAAQRDELDWPEAEWQSLMERITTQPPPRPILSLRMNPRTAWAYGAAALFLLAGLMAFFLRTQLLRPVPVPPTAILAWTEVQPGRSFEITGNRFSPVQQDKPYRDRTEQPRRLEPEALTASLASHKASQDVLSMILVSQDTGLKVHWTFNRNFEWKEEEKR